MVQLSEILLSSIDKMKNLGFQSPTRIPCWNRTPDREYIKQLYVESYKILLEQGTGEQYIPLPESPKILDWLVCNHSTGLMLYGVCGRGKSFLARYVIPMVLYNLYGIMLPVYDSSYAIAHTDEVKRNRYIVIDDIGREGRHIDFGSFRNTMSEIMDAVENQGKLLIMTSNLKSFDQFADMYGKPFADRMFKYTTRISFRSDESFRGSKVNQSKEKKNENADNIFTS